MEIKEGEFAVNKTWNNYMEHKPKLNKKVLIWRYCKEKYGIASLQLTGAIDEEPSNHWITEHGCCHEPHKLDMWLEFPYVVTQKEYC